MRIGHRPERDKRVTTHVALSSRALGAKGIFVDTEDPVLEENIRSVVERFGGDYTIKTGVSWKQEIKDFPGKVVHLTMYGQRVDEALPKIPRDEDILIVVGAEKVPAEVYQRADFNVSVGNQPHSEIAALAKPSILIPSPNVVRNHQEQNAREFEKHGAAEVITEAELTPELLYEKITSLLEDKEKLASMGDNLKKIAKTDALERIYELMLKMADKT